MTAPRPYRPARVRFVGSFPKEAPATTLPEIAFVGRSNVGKSSAVNTLLGRKKAARVSRTPGRTQAINLFELDEQLMFADLPGYGFAKVPEAEQERWGRAMERYFAERKELVLVVVLVDARHPGQKLDLQMVEALRHYERPHLVVATKLDQVKRSRQARHLKAIAQELGVPRADVLGFSSLDNFGVAEVWERLLAAVAS